MESHSLFDKQKRGHQRCKKKLTQLPKKKCNHLRKNYFCERKKKGTTGRSKIIGGWGLGVENRFLVGIFPEVVLTNPQRKKLAQKL